jgi:uncharacterized protein
MAIASAFVWFEYVSNDQDKAKGFFGELFGWKTKSTTMPHGSYTLITHGGERMLGGYVKPVEGGPQRPHWLPHLQVASAQESAAKVKSLGGAVVKAPFSLGEYGTNAIVSDPLGAVFALWQPVMPDQANDGEYKGEDGGWVWNELYTQDPDRSLTFYKALAGFDSESMQKQRDAPGPDRYEILKSGDKARAGVMKLAGVPPMWMPYVQVADTDAVVERAKKLGATFMMPAETIPGVGRIAVMADPLGGALGLLHPMPK